MTQQLDLMLNVNTNIGKENLFSQPSNASYADSAEINNKFNEAFNKAKAGHDEKDVEKSRRARDERKEQTSNASETTEQSPDLKEQEIVEEDFEEKSAAEKSLDLIMLLFNNPENQADEPKNIDDSADADLLGEIVVFDDEISVIHGVAKVEIQTPAGAAANMTVSDAAAAAVLDDIEEEQRVLQKLKNLPNSSVLRDAAERQGRNSGGELNTMEMKLQAGIAVNAAEETDKGAAGADVKRRSESRNKNIQNAGIAAGETVLPKAAKNDAVQRLQTAAAENAMPKINIPKANVEIENRALAGAAQTVQDTAQERSVKMNKAKDTMEKAGLQDMFAKLNARVASLENNAGNTGADFFNRQSTQEQLLRMNIQGVQETGKSEVFDMKVNQTAAKHMSAELPHDAAKTDILSQVQAKISASAINNTSKMIIQLTPESLGKISIEILNGKDGLSAKLIAQNSQVKDMLEKNIEGLKTALQNQGVNVNSVNIKVGEGEKSNAEHRNDEQNSQFEQKNQGNSQNSNNAYKEQQSEFEILTKMAQNKQEMIDKGNVNLKV